MTTKSKQILCFGKLKTFLSHISLFWETCMLSEEEEKCKFWPREYWVMCKAEPHGIRVAGRGGHLLTPEVSHFVAKFTIQ